MDKLTDEWTEKLPRWIGASNITCYKKTSSLVSDF